MPKSKYAGDLGYRTLPRLFVALQIAVVLLGALKVAGRDAGVLEVLGTAMSVGSPSASSACWPRTRWSIAVARPTGRLGLALLACVGYMHFRIAHIHGHHVRAASFDDPASARRGESAYAFVVGRRRAGARGLDVRDRRPASPRRGDVRPVEPHAGLHRDRSAIVACVAAFSLRALVFWLVQAALAILLLELFNYIAHYGLQRQRRPRVVSSGSAPQHSWNSSRRMNNWSLFNMGRHTDHHRHPSRAYQSLEADRDAPELPTGYAGSILPTRWSRRCGGRSWTPA